MRGGGCCCGAPEENTFSRRGAEFAENSSCSGLPNAYRAKSRFKRLLWILMVLGGTGMTTWQCYEIVMKYYSNETATGISMSYNSTMLFPAVTICNQNPIRLSAIHLSPELHALFVKNFEMTGATHTGNTPSSTQPASTTTTIPTTTTTTKAPSAGGLLGGGGGGGGSLLGGVGNLVDNVVDNVIGGATNIVGNVVDTVDGVLGAVADVAGETLDDLTWEEKMNTSDYFTTKSEFLQTQESFVNIFSHTNETTREALGHQLEVSLLSCDFGGFPCSPQNFSRFSDPLYGNCFTFNAGIKQPVEQITKTGPSYGLRLELYIQHDEYIEELVTSAGMKMLVHNQSYMPFPADNGFDLQPGAKTSVPISMLAVERSEPPHGECHVYSEQENREVNIYSEQTDLNISYTDEACYKTCFQRNVMKECGCCYPYNPCEGFALNNTGDTGFCNLTNDESVECMSKVQIQFNNNQLGCGDICKPSCRELSFNSYTSTSLWPSNPGMESVIKKLERNDPSLKPRFENMTDEEKRLFVRDNVLRVDVYYQKLNYETVSTQPSYMLEDLLSDIGGQLGLFLGLSVVTAMEFVELFVDLFIITCFKCCTTTQINTQKTAWK